MNFCLIHNKTNKQAKCVKANRKYADMDSTGTNKVGLQIRFVAKVGDLPERTESKTYNK